MWLSGWLGHERGIWTAGRTDDVWEVEIEADGARYHERQTAKVDLDRRRRCTTPLDANLEKGNRPGLLPSSEQTIRLDE